MTKLTVDPPTKVIFRSWKGESYGDPILALFPELPSSFDGTLCVCYQHMGQHGQADYTHCMDQTRPATISEYQNLLRELRGRGYDNLLIREKATHQDHTKRYERSLKHDQ